MRYSIIILSAVVLSLSACRNNDNNSASDNLSGGSDNDSGSETSADRNFSCATTAGSTVTFLLSADKNTVTLFPQESVGFEYYRADEPDDSDNQPNSLIEYSRVSIPENPDQIKLSGPLVNGDDTGRLVIDEQNYFCSDNL